MKKIDSALDSLSTITEIIKNNSGWDFTRRILEIMCYIEQDEIDLVEFRIDTFRKVLAKDNNKNLQRIKVIYKILITLKKYGFNFKRTKELEKDNLSLLQKGEDEYYWDPLGFEIIRFDVWFNEH